MGIRQSALSSLCRGNEGVCIIRAREPHPGRTVRGIGAALIAGGLALGAGPSLVLQAVDQYLSRAQHAEAARWIRIYGSAPLPGRSDPAVVEPGHEGYLLEIPKIGVQAIVHALEPDVLAGRNTPTLKQYGVGQVPFTPDLRNVSPGADGTAVITGHRTTSGAPFRHLDRLAPGDLIVIRKGAREQRWTVIASTTVVPTLLNAIRSRPGVRRLAVVACTPPFSARERLIVYATLLDVPKTSGKRPSHTAQSE